MDNHGDTRCFGADSFPISFTLDEGTVSPFLYKYSEQAIILIFPGITNLTLYYGEVFILEFGKGLGFGNCMEKSIINPNKCLKFGIKLYKDPNKPHRKLVIEAYADLFIPTVMEVSTCGLISQPSI